MRLLRAIVFGIILWLLIFFEVSILMFGFKLQPPDGLYYLLHFIFLVLFTLLCSLSYFWVSKMRGGFIHGFVIGLLFIIVLVVLDSIITIPFFIKDYNFLTRIDIIIGELVILVLTSIVGIAKK